jgi:hypothetical protein
MSNRKMELKVTASLTNGVPVACLPNTEKAT